MSRYFPHTSYAEDQPYGHAILTTHVLTRGVTAGTIVGLAITAVRQAVPSWRRPGAFSTRVLLSSASGSLYGLGFIAVGLAVRMAGREKIEWQDRSWRLLENKGQLETDDWTYGGMVGGAAAAVATGQVRAHGWRAVVGGAGAGSVLGTLGYLAWRHGLNGGKFPESKEKAL